MKAKAPDASIRFMVDEALWGLRSETMWADHLGRGRYRLRNIPMMVYGVSLEDIVSAVKHPSDPCPTFRRTIIKSGNRTLRVAFNEPIEDEDALKGLLVTLSGLGCRCEGFDAQFFGINVPSNVPLARVTNEILNWPAVWELADPE
ncbi:MAG: DUF4265 domain-containing protein [Pseudomonadales bacterium]|nr:DUF4265 domain-containing protein [Pseudomonadales bacterium]